jgi:hypothetical protein
MTMKHKSFWLTSKTLTALAMAGALVLTAASALITGLDGVWGGLIGFLVGLTQYQWLFRDLGRAMEGEMTRVMALYLRSLLIRWSFAAAVVFLMVRWFPQGLVFLVIGFAIGISLAIISEMLRMTRENSA